MRISTLRWTEFHQNRKDPIREIQRFPNLGHNLCENDKQTLNGLYLINYEIHLFILGIVLTDGSLQVSKTLYGLVNARDFKQSKHIEIIVFAICWRLSAFKSPSHEKSIFLKIRSFFSFKFFQGHNWLTNYPDAEFHGHWKTVTLSSISPNLSKHWKFLAFWLSLCFGSCLLFLVCHYTAFLFSTRAKTALGWLPNAHRDIIILVQWDRPSLDT